MAVRLLEWRPKEKCKRYKGWQLPFGLEKSPWLGALSAGQVSLTVCRLDVCNSCEQLGSEMQGSCQSAGHKRPSYFLRSRTRPSLLQVRPLQMHWADRITCHHAVLTVSPLGCDCQADAAPLHAN